VMKQRNQLAHGVWVRDPDTGTLILRVTKGSWQPVKGQRGKTKRLVSPEGIEFGRDDAIALRLAAEHLAHAIDAFGLEVRSLLRSRRTERKREQRDDRDE